MIRVSLFAFIFYFVVCQFFLTGGPAAIADAPELPDEPVVHGCQTLSDFRAEAAVHRIAADMVPLPPPQEAPPPDQPEETAPTEVAICNEPIMPPEAAQDQSSSSDSGQFRVFLIFLSNICAKKFVSS